METSLWRYEVECVCVCVCVCVAAVIYEPEAIKQSLEMLKWSFNGGDELRRMWQVGRTPGGNPLVFVLPVLFF